MAKPLKSQLWQFTSLESLAETVDDDQLLQKLDLEDTNLPNVCVQLAVYVAGSVAPGSPTHPAHGVRGGGETLV